MTLDEAISWIEDKATEQGQLGDIQEMEDYMQVTEYLKDLKSSLDNDGDTLDNLLRLGY